MPIIVSDWPAPANVLGLTTTRSGGCSLPPWEDFNLAAHVGDELADVEDNRASLQRRLPPRTQVQWLQQVHGCEVVEALGEGAPPEADACWTRTPLIACAVLTADCLPVLLCDRHGTAVAAVHAGWRGILGGVLEQTVASMHRTPEELLAWFGPAIGPQNFEVGEEVRQRFIEASDTAERDSVAACFSDQSETPGTFMADIYGLARQRLYQLGLTAIYGGGHCTVADDSQFFSYRREGQTGRMASLVLMTGYPA